MNSAAKNIFLQVLHQYIFHISPGYIYLGVEFIKNSSKMQKRLKNFAAHSLRLLPLNQNQKKIPKKRNYRPIFLMNACKYHQPKASSHANPEAYKKINTP